MLEGDANTPIKQEEFGKEKKERCQQKAEESLNSKDFPSQRKQLNSSQDSFQE
jgi:hypothetical protein